jgi:hypothetical protein
MVDNSQKYYIVYYMIKIISVFILLFTTVIQAEEVKDYKLKGDTSWYMTVEKGIESDLNYGYLGNSTPVLDGFMNVNWSATWQLFTPTGETQEFSSQTLGVSKMFTSKWSGYISNNLDKNFKRTETWIGATYSW